MNEKDIFQVAVMIDDPAQRQAFLNQACAVDPALRTRLERLLASHAAVSQFLNVPAMEQLQSAEDSGHLPTVVMSQAAASGVGVERSHSNDDHDESDLSFLKPSSKPGSMGTLGHYEVLQVLGQGAFGIVFKAFDEKLHRLVAIKAMNPQLAATSPPRKRFLREARSAAAIKHENIVQVYSVEEQPLPYLVMEYVAGQTLQQKLDGSGPLEVVEVLHLGRQMAAGLAAAHAQGLIHRDIKPGNILLEAGADQKLKITDFGLARAADDATMTRTGTIAGTPMYMAPEQAQGQSLDHRTDLFSLGSVLYQMTSGRAPFRAPNAMAVLKRVIDEPPRSIQEIIPEAPNWLCAMIGKLQAKSPADRFQSAKEVADLLGRCLAELQQRGRVESLGDKVPMLPQPSVATKPTALVAETDPKKQPIIQDKPTAEPHGRTLRRYRLAAAAVIMVLLASLVLTEAIGVSSICRTVVRLFLPEGTLVVEVDDPGASVSIDGEELVIIGSGSKEVRLKIGQYKVLVSKNGKVIWQELVRVNRNGRQVVRVNEEAAAATPEFRNPLGVIADPDRRAAEWVLSIGGRVQIRQENQERSVGKPSDLPTGSMELLTVVVPNNDRVTDAGLSNITGCKNLTWLELSRTPVTDAGLAHFKGLRALRQLGLAGTAVTDAGLAHLAELTTLFGLNLEDTKMTGAGLTHLQGFRSLSTLVLTNTELNEAGLDHLKDFPGLTSLNLTGNRVSDADLVKLEDLKDLEAVTLSNTQIGDGSIDVIGEWSKLGHVLLHGTKVTVAGVKKLAVKLPKCRIEWDGGLIEPTVTADPDRRAAEWIIGAGGWVQIAVDDQQRGAKSLDELPIGPFRNIGIALWGKDVDDTNIEHLRGLTQVQELGLFGARITAQGMESLRGMTELRMLDLGSVPVTDTGMSALRDMTKLEILVLNQSQVTDAGLEQLKQASHLRELYLNETGVGDAGLEHVRGFKNLRVLWLAGSKVSDDGLKHLSSLKQLGGRPKDDPDSPGLDLRNTRITDAGLEHLKQCNGLVHLNLNQTQVTADGVKALRNALPQCKIVSDHGIFDPTEKR